MAYVSKENKRYENFAYIKPDGTFYDNTGISGDVKQRDYFKQAMSGTAAVSDPVLSRSTGKMVTVVAVPVKTGGKVTGVLFGAISMEKVTKRVLSIKIGQTGYAYVLQQDGLAIIHPDRKIAMRVNAVKDPKLPQILREVNERIVKGTAGSTDYDYNGSSKIISFTPVPDVKWFLAIDVPTAEVTEAVAVLTKISLATIITVLLLTSIIIIWLARRIAKPIVILQEAANRIADGDLAEINLGIVSNDEVGRLGHSFEQMTRKLRELIREILQAADQMAASSEQFSASAEQSSQAANQIATAITDVAAGNNEQMDAVKETTAVVQQMSASSQQVAANANHAAVQSVQAVDRAQAGSKSVEKVVAQMNQIDKTVNLSAQVVAKLGERSRFRTRGQVPCFRL